VILSAFWRAQFPFAGVTTRRECNAVQYNLQAD
jgi:hypothetical protein